MAEEETGVLDAPSAYPEDAKGEALISEAELIARWGWESPPDLIREEAKRLAPFYGKRAGEIAVGLNVVSQEQLSEALQIMAAQDAVGGGNFISRVAAALGDPTIMVRLDEILAAQKGYQYIEGELLPGLNIHPVIRKESDRQDIAAQCAALDCILLEIEGEVPVVLFSSYSALFRWDSLGGVDRNLCPLHTFLQNVKNETGHSYRLSLGTNEGVIALINGIAAGSGATVAGQESVYTYAEFNRNSHAGVKKLGQILDVAANRGDTDISIVLQPDGTGKVFTRVSTDLMPFSSVPQLNPEEMASLSRHAMYISGANPSNSVPRRTLDGRIDFQGQSSRAEIRCSFLPIKYERVNEYSTDMSFRLLPNTGSTFKTNLAKLGLVSEVEEAVLDALRRTSGMILVAGPTNSGKSTTCAGILGEHQELFGTTRKRISLEQPVERRIDEVIQVSVDKNIKGQTFDDYFEGLLRHDPDFIFIGEIRDPASAKVGVAAAVSGHVVLSTTHANNSILAYRKLLKYAGESDDFDLVQALSLIIGQRLVKGVCPKCKVIREATKDELWAYVRYQASEGAVEDTPEAKERFLEEQLPKEIAERNPDGCDLCGRTGIRKRPIPVNEVLPIPRSLKETLLSPNSTLADIDRFRKITLVSESLRLLREHQVLLPSIYL